MGRGGRRGGRRKGGSAGLLDRRCRTVGDRQRIRLVGVHTYVCLFAGARMRMHGGWFVMLAEEKDVSVILIIHQANSFSTRRRSCVEEEHLFMSPGIGGSNKVETRDFVRSLLNDVVLLTSEFFFSVWSAN